MANLWLQNMVYNLREVEFTLKGQFRSTLSINIFIVSMGNISTQAFNQLCLFFLKETHLASMAHLYSGLITCNAISVEFQGMATLMWQQCYSCWPVENDLMKLTINQSEVDIEKQIASLLFLRHVVRTWLNHLDMFESPK